MGVLKKLLRRLCRTPEAAAPEAKKDDPKAAQPAPAAPANKWQVAVNRIRTTCDWLIATMGAIAATALGSGAFLGFDKVDSWQRAGWVVWGLSLTVAGALVVLWRATLVKLPVSGNISALLPPRVPRLERIATLVEKDLEKQHYPPLSAFVEQRKTWDDELFALKERIATLAPDPTKKQELATAESRLGYVEWRRKDVVDDIRDLLHRSMYLDARCRFVAALRWIFAGALMVAVGFPTYFAAARLDTEPSTEAAGSVDGGDLAVPVPAAATFTTERVTSSAPECLRPADVRVLVLGGDGSAGSPWRLRVLPTRTCPSAFDLVLPASDVTLRAEAADPALTRLVAPAPGDDPITWGSLSGGELASLAIWALTLVGYVGLLVAVGHSHDQGT